MFIKLQFTANTRITVPFRILNDIINTSNITSVSALQARFTSATYDTTITANFDAANSLIYRTINPTNTKSNFSYWQRADWGDFMFTLEQPVYDAPSSKIYTQIRTPAAANQSAAYQDVGTAITGGTITSSSTALTIPENYTASAGTTLTLGGNNYGYNSTNVYSGAGFDNVRTFWAYINDKCFFWGTTNGTSYSTGWPSTFNTQANYTGPFFATQYTRFDYHNLDSNGIYPVMQTNQRGGNGYGTTADLTAVQNLTYTANLTTIPLRVHSLVSALPQVGSSWPKIYNSYVHMTMAGRTSAHFGLNKVQTLGAVATSTALTYAGAFSSAASTRYPNTTLSGTGFGLLPFGWEANMYGNHGGNASDQSGVYFFNGDYVAGDTFVYNNAVYMIWPLYVGVGNRLGLAVPLA